MYFLLSFHAAFTLRQWCFQSSLHWTCLQLHCTTLWMHSRNWKKNHIKRWVRHFTLGIFPVIFIVRLCEICQYGPLKLPTGNICLILLHLVKVTQSCSPAMLCSSKQEPMPEAPIIMFQCPLPKKKKLELCFCLWWKKLWKHASADSRGLLSQLRCALTFSIMKILLGAPISAPQQAWLLMGWAWVGSCSCATYDKPHYRLAMRQA